MRGAFGIRSVLVCVHVDMYARVRRVCGACVYVGKEMGVCVCTLRLRVCLSISISGRGEGAQLPVTIAARRNRVRQAAPKSVQLEPSSGVVTHAPVRPHVQL